ncbi:MAG TPA: metallophosphoesterase [Pyrinomonadaceae bacterium]|nr:metallophosphoesterase [Pyrinomonadaceae bacterium]
MRRSCLILLLMFFGLLAPSGLIAQPLSTAAKATAAPTITLPMKEGSVRIAVFGDTGRGSKEQYELGALMHTYHQAFPYDTVLMTGDNIYGTDKADDMKKKFEDVYKPLIDQGVKFYASLGNHDASNQRFYALFNMKGEEYFRFEKGNVAFYSLNSNYMDKRQLDWLTSKLAADTNKWKIAYFHHPPFSSGGRHGSDEKIREVIHPLFIKTGVDVVFTGHDHFYERIKPQDGITYFVAGAGGKVRPGDIKKSSPITAKAYDKDLSFMLVEIVKDEMFFQVITRKGETVDSGVIKRRN